MFFKSLAENPSITGCGLSEIIGIFLFRNILILQYLAIDKKRVIGYGQSDTLDSLASCGHIPEIIFLDTGSRVNGIGMNADMFCRVITETTYAHLDQFVYKLHIIFLKIGILCIDIRESARSP